MSTSARSRASKPRLDSLTGMRWWAALAVLVAHSTELTTIGYRLVWVGSAGVAFFFVLSGFVLAWSARPATSARTFYRRRFARIYPLYLITGVMVGAWWWSLGGDASPGNVVLYLTMTQAWVPDATRYVVNAPAWTLSVEAFFYALTPVLLLVRLPRRVWLAVGSSCLALPVAVAGVLLAVGMAEGSPLGTFLLHSPVAYLPMFVSGMAAARAMADGWRPAWSPAGASAVLVLVVVVLWSASLSGAAVVGLSHPLVAVCALGLIASSAARELAGRPSHLRSRALQALGAWSYAVYLVQFFAFYTVREVAGDYSQIEGWLLWLLAVAMTVALAAGLHRWVEAPAERWLRDPAAKSQGAPLRSRP